MSRGLSVVVGLVAAGDGGWPRAPGVVSLCGAHFSFGARVLAECSWELSRLLNSLEGRQAARNVEELAGTGVVPPRGRLGLKDSLREMSGSSWDFAAVQFVRSVTNYTVAVIGVFVVGVAGVS